MAIRRLPSAVVSSLRTDVSVTTTAQCVTELVLNSIDAGATAVAVRVDLKNFRIQVVDNGCGLSHTDLNVIGKRYMTSKCNTIKDLQANLQHYGFRGEALSSISEVCGTLTIVSRHYNSDDTFCKIFTKGIAHRVGKSSHPRASSGTTITVADFLYNRPVRRARIKAALDLEEIKTHMESIAVINPQVSLSLRNDSHNDLIIQTQRVNNIPSVFSCLFGESLAKSLVAVKESKGPFNIDGFISREAHPLKSLQFIYINKRLLLKTKLHKLVNSIMSRSSFIKSNNVPYAPISKEINHNLLLAFSPPKRDKHAVFVLNITCPLSEYDISLDPKKSLVEFCDWDSVLSCLECLVRNFIDKEAGLSVEKNIMTDSEPPKKIMTIVDEMNQLDREEEGGLDASDILKSKFGSVSTRDLSRAIHCLPVSRHQVNLPTSPSSDFISSTGSSDSLCGTLMQSGFSNILCSATTSILTEKPYPTTLEDDSSHKKEAKGNPFSSSTEKSCKSRVNKISDEKTTKNLHFEENLKKLISLPIDQNKETKEENFCPISPINALTNIKEIRRKKLVQNLNKFSFKGAFERPVLQKIEIAEDRGKVDEVSTKAKADISEPDSQVKRQNLKPTSPERQTKQSRAVQTSFTPGNLCDTKLQGTASPVLHDSSLTTKCFRTRNNFSSSIASKNRKDDFSHLERGNLKNDLQHGSLRKKPRDTTNGGGNSFDLFALSPFFVSNKTDLTDNVQEESLFQSNKVEFRKLLSPTKRLVSEYETASLVSSENTMGSLPRMNSSSSHLETSKESTSPVFSAFEESHNFRVTSESAHRVDFNFHQSGIENKTFVDPHWKSRDNHTTSCKLSSDSLCDSGMRELPVDCTVVFPTPHVAGVSDHQLSVKLVDYDSSPPSSQNTTASVSGEESFENCELKRKLNDIDVNSGKKRFILHNNVPLEEHFQNDLPSKPGGPCSSDVSLLSRNCHDLQTNKTQHDMQNPQQSSSSHGGVRDLELMANGIGNCLLNFNDSQSTEKKAKGSSNDLSHLTKESIEGEKKELSQVTISSVPCSNTTDKPHEAMNVDEEWIEGQDHSGKLFYIHQKSGFTSYKKPEENRNTFKFHDRFDFLPKGMSPILRDKFSNEPSSSPNIVCMKKKPEEWEESDEAISTIKWGGIAAQDTKTSFWPLVDQLLSNADAFSNNLYADRQVINANMQELPKSDVKVYNVIFPYSFTKDIFKKLMVLGQLDNKFIVTLALVDGNREVIVLFDQHAVHERIRVEKLTDDYKQPDGTAIWKSCPIDPALPLSLSSIEVRILESYMDKMNSLGFYFKVIDSNNISVEKVPTCLLLRENREVAGRGVSVLRQHLESLIREQVDSILNTRGVGSDHPTIIRNVISSEACRGAVKFGHALTIADCRAFLHNLSSCNLPFQCAHGRPALMPIMDLSQIKKKVIHTRLNLQKLKRLKETLMMKKAT